MSKDETLPRLLTHEEVARLFNVSKVTIRRLRYSGELSTVRIRGHAARQAADDAAYLSATPTAPVRQLRAPTGP